MNQDQSGLSRRAVLKSAGAAAFFGLARPARAEGEGATPARDGLTRRGPGPAPVRFTLNSQPVELQVEPRVTLLDALRERLELTGTKPVCDRGACGACTVWVDGKTVNACLMLCVDAADAEVTTIEGLAPEEGLHSVQAAFVAEDAQQCGFCTPGMVMSCAFLLKERPAPSDAEIREAVAGNLCRCGTYPHVFAACRRASR